MTATLAKKITYSEFRQMEFDDADPYFYELINGILVKKSAPTPQHQEISANLNDLIRQFVKQNKLGKTFYAPIDVFLDENNVPQPDLVFVSTPKIGIIDYKEGILGVPDLVVEIISPSSIRQDKIDKKNLYERFALPEYWLIDPRNGSIEVYVFENNHYQTYSFASVNGKVASKVLAGFEIDLADIF